MARTLKAALATKNDAVKADAETVEDTLETKAAGTEVTTATTVPASEEQTGGDGDPAVSPDAPSEVATENPDGSSNDAEMAPAAIVEGIVPVDALEAVAPELATVNSPEASEPDDDDDDSADVICRAKAFGGPRRRANLAFDTSPRPLTRADLGGTDKKIKETLQILAADPRLSLLPPTD